MTPAQSEPVAIIGLGCRYPDSSNPGEFWRNQISGHRSFAPVDPVRWDHSRFFTTGRDPDGTACDRVAHLRHIDYFAASHFNIAARRAEVMDPQQRILLEVTWEAMQDAGLRPEAYDRSRSAAYVGCSISEYSYLTSGRLRERQMQAGQFGTPDESTRTERLAAIRAYSLPGALQSMTASVLNQFFDWGGPSLSIDGACASSLLSVHHACQYLLSLPGGEGPAPVAVAAGVYLNLVPDNLVAFSRIGALACEPSTAFDVSASGFLLGEGAGAVILKRLSQAQRDGDRIYATIRSTAHNSDGSAPTPMTPILPGQQRLLAEGLGLAQVQAASIGYLECHGTGTPVGDEIELKAWRSVLGSNGARPWIGSVKANMGHTLSAAGLAGLMRAALAIYHRAIPCHAGWQSWHPKLAEVSASFQVPEATQAWDQEQRLAAVTSFGFGGINCLAVLEQAPPAPSPGSIQRPLPFVVSAPNRQLLQQYCSKLVEWLPQQQPAQPLSWIAYTLSVLRHHHQERRIFWAESESQLIEALHKWEEAPSTWDEDLEQCFAQAQRYPADLPPAPLERRSYWVVGSSNPENHSQSERQVRGWLARTCGWPLAVPHSDPHLIHDLGLDSMAVLDLLTLLPPLEKQPTLEQLTVGQLLQLCRQAEKAFTGTKLGPSTHPFLLDHALNKAMLLPLASGLDFLAWSANLQVPWTLNSVQVHRPLLFRDSAEIRLQREEQMVQMFDVRPDGREVLVMSARQGVLGQAPVPAAEIEPGWDLQGELQRFYREQTFHGTRLHGIARLEKAGPQGVVGMVRTSIPRDWAPSDPRARWHFDPLVVDSSLQLALYWVMKQYKRAVLPHAIEEVALQVQLQAGLVEARVYPRNDSELGPIADVLLYQSNRQVGWLRGVQARWVESLPQRSWSALPPEWTSAELLPEVVAHGEALSELRSQGDPYFQILPRETISFCHYNYVGLAQHPRLIEAATDAVRQYGCSAQASRLVGGELDLHRQLEQLIASFLGQESALALVAGHATNVSLLSHYMKKPDLILHDSLSHNSILQGAMASQARRLSFPHNDMTALENTLRKVRTRFRRVLLVVEGIYSMDGDIAPLPELLRLKNRYGCLLMIDEAHSLGVLGSRGRGICEHFGVNPREVDILMGTLSKTLASCGGYLAGSQETIDYLRYTLPGFIFSVGLAPPLTASAKAALEVLQEEPYRVERLRQLSNYFWRGCQQLGLPLGSSEGTPVVPIILGDSQACSRLCWQLKERGIEVKPIIYPAVEESAARLRFFLSYDHTEEQLDHTLKALRELLT
jgi:8-amino-7-oxononanoate synthase